MLRYAAVIPTKDRPARACAVVESLLEQTQQPEQVIVVDASTPRLEIPETTRGRLQAAEVDLLVLHTEPSTARQRNLGVDLVKSPLVLFLDDDVRIEPGYAQTLLERWEAAGLESRGAMVGSPAHIPAQSRIARLVRRMLMLHYHATTGPATRFRRSGKLRFVARPTADVGIPAVGAGGALFRTDLARRHRFDERFPGYALGEDIEMSWRLAQEAPIVQTPAVRFLHEWDPRERRSAMRWHHRGRRETYFRLRHLDRSFIGVLAFTLSIAAEAAAAAIDSLRERDVGHLHAFVAGVVATLDEERRRRA